MTTSAREDKREGGVLEKEIRASLSAGRLPCAAAFEVARKLKTSRRKVGDEANRLKIRVADCQLGCFSVAKATHADLVGKKADDAVKKRVLARSFDGMLPCPEAFAIARGLNLAPKEVCDAATILDVKIVGCQLGCF